MNVELKKVETIIDSKVGMSENSTSAYVYIPKEHAGKKVKICIMEN